MNIRREKRFISITEAAAYAGITRSGMSQRKKLRLKNDNQRYGKSELEKKQIFYGRQVDIGSFREETPVKDRENLAKGIASAMEKPVIITDFLGRVLGVSYETELLLWKFDEEMISYRIEEVLGCPAQVEDGLQVRFLRKTWEGGKGQVIKIRVARSEEEAKKPIPAGLESRMRKRVEQGLKAVQERRPDVKWTVDIGGGDYPALGGGTIEITIKKISVGSVPSGFLIYELSSRDLITEIAGDNTHIQTVKLEEAQKFLRERLDYYTKQIALEFPSEFVTLFLLFPPLHYLAIDFESNVDDPDSLDPIALFAVSSFGLPPTLTRREVFRRTEEGNIGFVMEVIQSGESLLCDLKKEEDKQKVRYPNFFNADFNLRSKRADHALIVPLMLPPSPGEKFPVLRCMGALRLFNCLKPDTTSPFNIDRGNISHRLQKVERVTRELAVMFRVMMRTTYAEIVDFANKHLSPPWRLEGFIELLLEKIHSLLDFHWVTVWCPSSDGERMELINSVSDEAINVNTLPMESSPGRAFRRAQIIDVVEYLKESKSAEEEKHLLFGTGSAGAGEPYKVRSGFEIPIRNAANGQLFGILGLYNSAQALGVSGLSGSLQISREEDVYVNELRRVCESLADLIGMKAALFPENLKAILSTEGAKAY